MKNLQKYLSIMLTIVFLLSTMNVQGFAENPPTVADHLVISQIYGGGGNSGAPYSNDFIELYNPTDSAVDLTGWSVQYASATGTSFSPVALSGTIQAGGYYLIQQRAGSNPAAALPTPDAVGSSAMSAKKGKIALVNGTTSIANMSDANVVDFVGFGAANEFEGAATVAPDNTHSVMRTVSGVDTDHNENDFSKVAPNPRNSTYSDVPATKCETPTSDTSEGAVLADKMVTFSTTTLGASIEYNKVAADSADWTVGTTVTVTEDTTYYVRATKDGLENSDVATFAYTIDTSAAITITEAKALADDTENVKISGVVTYIRYQDVYVQDGQDAMIVRLTGNSSILAVGDSIVASGKKDSYYNLPQLTGVVEADVQVVSQNNAIPNAGTVSIEQLLNTPEGKTAGYDYICEMVTMNGVTLTSTSLLTQNGFEIKVYPTVKLTDFTGIEVGDVVNLKARFYDYKGTLEVEIIDMDKAPLPGSIRAAKEMPVDTENVEVNGVVTYISGKNAYVQDGTDAICVRMTSNIGTLQVGDQIQAFGKRGNYYKLVQIADVVEANVVIASNGNPVPVAGPYTIAQLIAQPEGKTAGFDSMCEIITIEEAILTETGLMTQEGTTIALYPVIDLEAYPELALGDTVNVKARFYDYRGTLQLDVQTLTKVDTTPEPATITIAEAKNAAVGTEGLVVKGIVTYVKYKDVYVQDKTGGICIRLPENASTVQVGDLIIASGTRAEYKNIIQLSDIVEADIMIKSSGNDMPEYRVATTSQILATPENKTPGFDYMCEFVLIKDVVITGEKELTQNGVALSVYPAMTLKPDEGIEIGATVNVVARVNAYNGNVQVEAVQIVLPPAALTIKEVLALPSGTEDVVVTGQIAYFATTYGNPVLQAVIKDDEHPEGKIYSLYVFGSAPDGAKVGDVVKLTGKYTIYNGLPEMTGIVSSTILRTEPAMDPVTMTIGDINTNGLNMLGRFVKIENVTLGAFNGSGTTTFTDGTGSIGMYKGIPYPTMVVEGDVVDLYAMVSCFNTKVQLVLGTVEHNGFNVYDVVNDIKAPVVTLPDMFIDAKALTDYTISVDAADNKGIDTVTISYTIGDTTVVDRTMSYNVDTRKYDVLIASEQVLPTATEITFTITATDVSGLSTTTAVTAIPIVNKPEFTAVLPGRNSSTGEDKAPLISVSLTNAGENPDVVLNLTNELGSVLADVVMTSTDGITYTTQTDVLADGKYTASVLVTRNDGKTNTETWSFYIGESEFSAYFGQFHSHTTYSDGSGSLVQGLDYFLNIPVSDNVDFVSFTDHSNYFDSKTAANPAGALNDTSLMTAESLATWNEYKSTTDTFNQANADKQALTGYEMTWSGGPGHINTFNSNGLISRNNSTLNNKTADSGLVAY